MRQQTYSLYYYLFGVARVLRDDLLSRSIARAKATRSVSLLKLKARCAFNASSVASALPARAFLLSSHVPSFVALVVKGFYVCFVLYECCFLSPLLVLVEKSP